MAVNKNFVVKNGLEVNTNLIVADTDSQKVGIGTTISRYLLHVNGGTGIGASSVYVTGISTVAQEFNVGLGGSIFTVLGNAEGTAGIGQSVGVGTGEPAYLLDVRAPVSTGQTALYVQGDVRVTGDVNLDDLRLDQLQVSGISSFIGFSTFASGITVLGLGATTTTLNVTGVSTFTGNIDANGSIDIDGHTELDDLNVAGVSTLATLGVSVASTTKDLLVTGVSSVTGVSTAALFGGYSALSAPASAETKNFSVTVASKTSNNRYSGGSGNAYYIDGIEAPFLTLTPGRTYRFTLSSSDMSNHPFRFYLNADRSTQYTSNVTSTATYTEITVFDTTPAVLHYACSNHGLMGNGVQTNSNTIVVSGISTFTGNIDANANLDVDGTTDLDVLNVAETATFSSNIDANGDLDVDGTTNLDVLNVAETATFSALVDIDGHAELDDLNVSGVSTFAGAADFNGHTELSNVNIAGFSTFVSNVDINAQVDISTDILVGGASTFTGAADFNGAVDVDGHTELDDVNVSGASTFTGTADFNGHTELSNVNVAGFSTFVGFATFSNNVQVAGIITATTFSGTGQIGVGSEGTFIGAGITMVDFKSSSANNTVDVDGTSGIATVTVTTGVSIGLAIALGG
tara:strand:- start:943 stop:2832 length:1890 start_codon:yes stop_codon:yes gene_type:complete